MIQEIPIGIVDDHGLIRDGIAEILADTPFRVTIKAANGTALLQMLSQTPAVQLPKIILADINMPAPDGYETTEQLHQQFPEILVCGLSMFENENSILRLMQCGAKGYINKGVDKKGFTGALTNLATKGYHIPDFMADNKLQRQTINTTLLSPRETEFIILCGEDLSYKEIAGRMFISIRTVHYYHDCLCEKLGIKTRIGLSIYAHLSGLAIPKK